MTYDKAKDKVLTHLVSWKFQLLVLSTVLFIKGVLTESGWLIMAASTTGLREVTGLMTAKMGQSDGVVDDPDAKPTKRSRK